MKCDDVKFSTSALGYTAFNYFLLHINPFCHFIETELSDMLFNHCHLGPFTHEISINKNEVTTPCENHWVDSMSGWSDKL